MPNELDRDRAFGRDGYVREGLADAARGVNKLATVAVILAGLFVAWHVLPALMVRDNPPLSCQLAGGTWNLWSGWRCA